MQKILGFPFKLLGVKYNLIGVGLSEDSISPDYYHHNHDYVEFHYIVNGSWELSADNKTYFLGKNSAVLIPVDIYHHFVSATKDAERFELAFKVEDKRAVDAAFGFKSDRCIVFKDDQMTALAGPLLYIENIVKSDNMKLSEIDTEKVKAMSSVFVAELYSALYETPAVRPEMPENSEIKRKSVIEAFFSHNFNKPDLCKGLSKKLNISERQLNRIIKQTYGISYREKLNETKLQNAYSLLYNSEMTVSEIASFLGYQSPANFTAFFKKQTGKTPLAARNDSRSKTKHGY